MANRTMKNLRSLAVGSVDLLTSKWVKVVGESMMPTLQDGSIVRVSRKAYWKCEPARWEVVLFLHPGKRRFWELKRVVALPGERVDMSGDSLIIDGKEINDPLWADLSIQLSRSWHLSEDEYLVFGDNRHASTDSRNFGPIKRSSIHGRAVLPAPIETDEELRR